MELYRRFLSNINNNLKDPNIRTHTKNRNSKKLDQEKRYIKKYIENYLDNSILNNYDSKYNTFEYIYDIEHKCI